MLIFRPRKHSEKNYRARLVFNERYQLVSGYRGTILRRLDRSHAAGISLVALSFYIIRIHLNCAAIPATIYLLRVQTEISWSHSTIRGNVYNGTSQ
jgi:hypothetical protein